MICTVPLLKSHPVEVYQDRDRNRDHDHDFSDQGHFFLQNDHTVVSNQQVVDALKQAV